MSYIATATLTVKPLRFLKNIMFMFFLLFTQKTFIPFISVTYLYILKGKHAAFLMTYELNNYSHLM